MNFNFRTPISAVVTAAALTSFAGAALAGECRVSEASMAKPGGFPDRALTMIVPYGPGGGSGQVAAAMAEAVTELTSVSINRDHKPGGSGTVGMTAYMAAPADGYTVLEHIDDASSAHALDSSKPNPAVDLIPLVISQVTFSQIYIRTNETRYTDWPSFVEWVRAQDGKATIANVSKEGSMERVIMKFITEASDMEIQQISFDKGVCGKAWSNKKTLIVQDVHQFPGHIACSSDSNSEIVVPLLDKAGEVLGVLDIDSIDFNSFNGLDQLWLEKIIKWFVSEVY